jgi:hypothetical protein
MKPPSSTPPGRGPEEVEEAQQRTQLVALVVQGHSFHMSSGERSSRVEQGGLSHEAHEPSVVEQHDDYQYL